MCIKAGHQAPRHDADAMVAPRKSDLVIQDLAPAHVRAVYPLVLAALPTLSLSAWLRHARRLMAGEGTRSGIVVAIRPARGLPCGLFCWRRERELAVGEVLRAEHFVALDLLDHDAVLGALVAGLDGLARRLGCTAIRSVVHGQAEAATRPFLAAGHAPQAAVLWKRVSADPAGGSDLSARARPAATRPIPTVRA